MVRVSMVCFENLLLHFLKRPHPEPARRAESKDARRPQRRSERRAFAQRASRAGPVSGGEVGALRVRLLRIKNDSFLDAAQPPVGWV
jgi:hypothetical protein